MAKSDKSIEPAVLEELNRLGADRDPIVRWLEGLEASRESVSEVVYRRVREDYTNRIADLDRLASGLRIEATRTIAALAEQLAELETEKRSVEVDLKEVELRHWLEEYSEAEFKERAQAPRERITELGLELEKLRATRELWLAARGEEVAGAKASGTPEPAKAPQPAGVTSVVTLEPAPPPPLPAMPAMPSMPSITAKPATIVSVAPNPVEITLPHPIPPPRASSPAIPLPQAAPPLTAPVVAANPPPLDRTMVYTPMPPSLEAESPGDPGAATLRLLAKLVPVDAADGSAQEHSLTPENTLGRVRENSIQIQQGSVSRHHAILRLTAEAWTLEDLKAENGTWVNGERIDKRRLADGDRVNIGTVRFIFRLG